MIKDRPQKQLAAKFCAARRMVPFAEVIVRSSTDIEEKPVDITDLDVVGLRYGHAGIDQRILLDCKSGFKTSAINRALWANGLKHFVGADEAYLIMPKDVGYSHKLAAAQVGVQIHTDKNFMKFASSISPDFDFDITYLANMDTWDALLINIPAKQPALAELVAYSNVTAALETNAPKGLRGGLALLRSAAGELDPRKRDHFLVFAAFVAASIGFAAVTCSELRSIFQFDMNKDDFERTTRYYVWGGKEAYDLGRKLRAAVAAANAGASGNGASATGSGTVGAGYELPEWQRFLSMMRAFLDAPDLLAETPYLAKEIAFRSFEGPRAEPDNRLRKLFNANNRARQFLFQFVAYLVAASGLPKEIGQAYEDNLNKLIDAPPTASETQGNLI